MSDQRQQDQQPSTQQNHQQEKKAPLQDGDPAFYSRYTEAERKQLRRLCSDFWTSRLTFYPRLVYDISLYRFFQYFLLHCAPCLLGSDEKLRQEVAKVAWPQLPERVLVTLSVRTFLDLLLTAMELPKGSEIIFSGMSIPQMKKICDHYGIVLRAFDIELTTFTADVTAAETLFNEKTRLVICAPLFGTHMPGIEKVQQLAKDRNVPFFMDLAQSWGVMHLYKHADADITAMSFGSIKFATALGGCVATVKDPILREKIRLLEKKLPVRSWSSQLGVIVKNSSAVLLANDAVTTAFVRNLVFMFGGDWADIVNALSRGFPGPNLLELIRRRPQKSLLKMLAMRLSESDQKERYRLKNLSGWDILSRLPNYVQVVGAGDTKDPENSTFWLFPIYCQDPLGANHVFHKNGIDSALGTSQLCSLGGGYERHDTNGNGNNNTSAAAASSSTTPKCDHFIRHILYIPAYPQLGEKGRDMLLKTIHAMPRSMIESPSEEFHSVVEKSPMKHAYRSPQVATLLKDRALFQEDFPRLYAAAAGVGVTIPAAAFALRSSL